MKLIQLKASNFKKLTAIEIQLGDETIVAGNNGSGKSSTLDAIKVLLGGAKLADDKPVKNGAEEAVLMGKVQGEDGTVYLVHRSLKAAGGTSIKITGEDGREFKSPQALLDGMLGAAGAAGIDPIMFATVKPEKRMEMMRELVKLDFSDLNARKKATEELRRDVTRDKEAIQAKWRDRPPHTDVPEKEIDLSELAAELQAANEHNAKIVNLGGTVDLLTHDVARDQAEVKRLEEELALVKDRLTKKQEALAAARQDLNGAKPIQTDAITARMNGVQETNAKVRENLERLADRDRFKEMEAQRVACEAELDAVKAEREKRLAEAPFPIPGLSFGEGDIEYNGVPFDQCSDGERIRVSTATMLAMAGQVRVITIHNASLLDKANLAIVRELAKEHGAQLVLELVESDDPMAIVIEDGQVKA